MNKLLNLVFVSFFLIVILVGNVNAFEIDNCKSYDEKNKKVTIKNACMPLTSISLGDEIATIKLNTPLDYHVSPGYQKVAEFTINNKEQYNEALKEINFYDKNKNSKLFNYENQIQINFDYKYKTLETIIVDDYQDVLISILSNGTKIYEYKKIGEHEEIREVWKDLNNKDLSKGEITIGIFTDVKIGDRVEWIPDYFGLEIEEFAIWTSDLSVNLVSYYRNDDDTTSGTTSVDSVGANNITLAGGVTTGVSGKIEEAYSFDGVNDISERNSTGLPSGNSARSFNFWFNMNSINPPSNTNPLLLYGSNVVAQYNILSIDASPPKLAFIGHTRDIFGTTTISTGTWYMATFTHDGTTSRLYLNGLNEGNKTQTLNTALTNMTLASGTSFAVTAYTNVTMDEVAIWNRSLSQDEIFDLYNNNNGLPLRLFPIVTLNSPIDNAWGFNPITFNCTSEAEFNKNLENISIYTNISGSFQVTNTTSGLSGRSFTETWDISFDDGNYLWSCESCDSEGICFFADINRTINVDSNSPIINITFPEGILNTNKIGNNETLNWTVTDLNLDTCWYDYNGTNTTVTCGDNTTKFILEENNLNLTFYANDSAGNEVSQFTNWAYKVLINNETFNSLTYETQEEIFSINLIANSSLTNVQLFYDGITYSPTQSGQDYSSTIQIPTGTGNITFKWLFTYSGESINTTENTQTVNLTEFVLCNATNNLPYINYTFLDEETLTNVSSTIDTSTFNYWLGDGTVSKTLIYSNSTPSNNQSFCFKPGTETMYSNRTVQYSATGYPQRRSYETSTLTNTTTNRILYLLSSADGIYSTFQVLDSNGQSLSGVQVLAERQFSGVWTTIGNDNTDDAGSVTFWLNPDFDHKFTFIKSGCTTEVFSVRPTQTNYVITMSCAGEQNITSIYASAVEGIRYNHFPATGILANGTHNFSFIVASDKNNIVKALFRIINVSNSVTLLERSSTCTPSGCTLSGNLTVEDALHIKGNYYVDIGGGYLLLEGDAFWKTINPNIKEFGTVKDFMLNMNNFFDGWDEENVNTSNRKEFTKFVFIFFFLCLFYAFFNKFTGYDSANPGIVIYMIFALVMLGSMSAGYDCANQGCQGLFYYGNLFGQDSYEQSGQAAGFMNNYILAIVMFFVSLGHLLSVLRRNS